MLMTRDLSKHQSVLVLFGTIKDIDECLDLIERIINSF